MVVGPVNRAGLPWLIRWLPVHHCQGGPGNRDTSLSLQRRRGVDAIGACALRVCGARRGFAGSACLLHVGDFDG